MDEPFYMLEKLFRGVNPNHWKRDECRPSSACFKDSKGASVNRALNNEKASFEHIDNDITVGNINAVAIVSVLYHDCENIGVDVVYCPVPENPYHSVIHRKDSDGTSAYARKAHALAKAVVVEKEYTESY
jgi:hypothetical protein